MAVKAGLKGGLIGAALGLVLSLLGLIPVPFLSCVCCGLTWLGYAGAGVLAGFFLPPPRSGGSGAGAGAFAGLLSGIVVGLVEVIILAISAISGGGGASALTPQQIEQLRQLGVDPQMLAVFTGVGGMAIVGGLCCITSLAAGAGLGAAGGAILGAAKRD
jgi:hypothetical protein